MIPMLIRVLFLVLLYLLPAGLRGQEVVDWETLADVEFHAVFVDEFGYTVDSAAFGRIVRTFEGETVLVKGFVIPLDALGTSYALSRNPNATCFFCGGAGPETVIQLKLKPSAFRRYEMDAVKTFMGKLRLNEKNADQFTYVLEEAEPAT